MRRFLPFILLSCLGVTACYRSAVGLRGVAGLCEVMTKGDRNQGGPEPVVRVIDAHTFFENPNDEESSQPSWGMEIAFKGANVLGTVVMAEQMKFFPKFDKKLSFAVILCGSPEGPRALKLLAKGLEQAKFHCVRISGSGDRSVAIALADKYRVPVILESTSTKDSWTRWEGLFGTHPRVAFVLASLGSPQAAKAAKAVAKYPNVYVDTGLVVFSDATARNPNDITKRLKEAMQPFAPYPNKVLFASSWPRSLINPAVDAVQAVFKREQWAAVFYRNANRIFRMGLDEVAFEVATSVSRGEKKDTPAGQ